MKKSIIAIAVAVLLALLSVTGCSQSKVVSNDGVKGITICESWGFESGFSSIKTPENSTNYGITYYLANFYETLVNYQDGKIVPGLAKSWQITDDGKVYTFYLEDDVKFSDGSEFNANVVKKNLESIPGLLGVYNGGFGPTTTLFEEIKVVDEYTVEVHLTAPYYGALQDFSLLTPLGMMSANAFQEDGTLTEALMTATMGTGPYMYNGQTDGNSYTFVPNPHYRGEKPEVETFMVKVIPDNEAKALALRSGEIDIIIGADKISYEGFAEFSEDENYQAVSSEAGVKTRFLGFNLGKEPFDNKNVRLAVATALDKQSICDHLFYGIETVANTLLSPALPYCNVAIQAYAYDREKAKTLLAEAGWLDTDGDGIREKKGQKLAGEILYITGKAVQEDLALAIAASLKETGMEIKVSGLEMMAWHAATQQGKFDLVLNQTYGVPYDPFTLVSNMNPDTQADHVIGQALSHVEGGKTYIAGLQTMVDEKRIQDRYDFIFREIQQNVSFVSISTTKELAVFKAGVVVGYTFNGQPSNVDITGIRLK